MYQLGKLFNVIRVIVAYRLEGMRKLLDKLAWGAAGNRWHARHLIMADSASRTVFWHISGQYGTNSP